MDGWTYSNGLWWRNVAEGGTVLYEVRPGRVPRGAERVARWIERAAAWLQDAALRLRWRAQERFERELGL